MPSIDSPFSVIALESPDAAAARHHVPSVENTMSKLQHIGLFLFVLLSAGLALGYRVDCADGSHVETYLLRGLGANLLGSDLCEKSGS